MKIIRKGKEPLNQELYEVTVYQVNCLDCGCIFEAQDTELYHTGGYSFCHCPHCGKEIMLYNNYSEWKKSMPREEIVHYDCSIHKRIK